MPRDLLPELPNVNGQSDTHDLLPGLPNIEQNKQSLIAKLLGLPQQGIGNNFRQNIDSLYNSPGMHAIQGAEDEAGKMLSLGLLNRPPQSEGTAYNVGRGLGAIGGFVGGGELADLARLGLGATKTGALPGISQGLRLLEKYSPAKRILGSAAYGAAENPEHRGEGALKSSAIQSALEGLSGAGKLVRLAEYINPIKATEQELGKIRDSYQASQAAQRAAYAPFNAISKENKLEAPKNYLDSLKINHEYMTPNIKKMEQKFHKEPSLSNAHRLQSQLFADLKRLSKRDTDAATLDKIQGIEDMRDSLNKDIIGALSAVDKNAARQYKEGTRIHREEIRPYLATPALANLVEGDIGRMQPGELISAIKPAKESRKIPQTHYLQEALKNIQSKVNKGKAAGYAIPAIGGAALSQLIHPGLVSALGGIGAGAYLGHGGGSKMTDFIQNPEVERFLQKLSNAKNAASPMASAIAQLLSR